MTHPCRRCSKSALAAGWRASRMLALAAAIGFGGWQAAQVDWSKAGRALDQALWMHALEDRVVVSDLHSAAPVWRERAGASGDKILERVDGGTSMEPAIAVLEEVSGQAIPSPVLAEQAVAQKDGAGLAVKPARFNGLTAGDRLTITTTDGETFTFEVVAAEDGAAVTGNIAIRVGAADEDKGSVLYDIRPVKPETPAALRPQQDL